MKYTIEQDQNATPPSEWGNTDLFLVANHRDFYVPEHGKKTLPKYGNELADKYAYTHHIFNLEAYIHGGVVLALSNEGNFPDRQWDVSQLGYVFASKAEWSTREDARKAALSLIKEWNMYLSGDVYGYVITDDDGEHIDSCWGFYGKEYCENEAKSVMAALEAKQDKQLDLVLS